MTAAAAMELVRHRRSVRTFDGAPLKAEDAQTLIEFAKAFENPYGQRAEWVLLSAKAHGLSSPVILGTDAYIAGKISRAPHAEEAFGYALEALVLRAEELGLGTTIIAGTMNRAEFERAAQLNEGEVMPCVSPLGYPAKKMSVRETLMRKGVKADSRFDFAEIFFDGAFDKPLTPEAAGDFAEPLEMVRWAPSAVNRQPWRAVRCGGTVHFYEKRTKGYIDSTGWDLQKVDMGIALYHFAFGIEAQGRKCRLSLEDPGIAAPDGVYYVASLVTES